LLLYVGVLLCFSSRWNCLLLTYKYISWMWLETPGCSSAYPQYC